MAILTNGNETFQRVFKRFSLSFSGRKRGLAGFNGCVLGLCATNVHRERATEIDFVSNTHRPGTERGKRREKHGFIYFFCLVCLEKFSYLA